MRPNGDLLIAGDAAAVDLAGDAAAALAGDAAAVLAGDAGNETPSLSLAATDPDDDGHDGPADDDVPLVDAASEYGRDAPIDCDVPIDACDAPIDACDAAIDARDADALVDGPAEDGLGCLLIPGDDDDGLS